MICEGENSALSSVRAGEYERMTHEIVSVSNSQSTVANHLYCVLSLKHP